MNSCRARRPPDPLEQASSLASTPSIAQPGGAQLAAEAGLGGQVTGLGRFGQTSHAGQGLLAEPGRPDRGDSDRRAARARTARSLAGSSSRAWRRDASSPAAMSRSTSDGGGVRLATHWRTDGSGRAPTKLSTTLRSRMAYTAGIDCTWKVCRRPRVGVHVDLHQFDARATRRPPSRGSVRASCTVRTRTPTGPRPR
jgi:hypothetical protein